MGSQARTSQTSTPSKNIIMRFLRLLLFFFVLLAPLQPAASHTSMCTLGDESSSCKKCCNECLTDRTPDEMSHSECHGVCIGRNPADIMGVMVMVKPDRFFS